MIRAFAAAAMTSLLAAAIISTAGCATMQGGHRISNARYDGPDVRIERRPGDDDRRGLVLVRLTAPSGGWQFTLDDVKHVDEDDAMRLFATLERPGEDEATTMALVQHTVETAVDGEMPAHIEVYIRPVQRGEAASDVGYRLAGRDP